MSTKVTRVTAYADGGSRGNPGQAACGVVLYDEKGEELLRRARRLGRTTNNVAEYNGVLLALELCGQLDALQVELKLDSELIVRQLEGKYKVKSPDLKPLHARAVAAIDMFEHVRIAHVAREENKVADKIVNAALDDKDIDEESTDR